jgi:hypothetical protein
MQQREGRIPVDTYYVEVMVLLTNASCDEGVSTPPSPHQDETHTEDPGRVPDPKLR